MVGGSLYTLQLSVCLSYVIVARLETSASHRVLRKAGSMVVLRQSSLGLNRVVRLVNGTHASSSGPVIIRARRG